MLWNGRDGQFCMSEGVAVLPDCRRIAITVQSCNPVAMGARDGRLAALVLYTPAVLCTNCDGIPRLRWN